MSRHVALSYLFKFRFSRGRLHRGAAAVCCLLVLFGCGGEKSEEVAEVAFAPVLPPSDPNEESWRSDGTSVVARVGASSLSVEDVQAVLNFGSTDDPERALQLAVKNEALSQWALAKAAQKGDRLERPRQRFRQALVQRLLQSEFEEKLRPETIPFEYIKGAFWSPSIRKRYIHFDAFRVKDIQFLCCLSVSECNFEPEAREPCFADGEKVAAKLFAQVQARNPKTPEEFDGLAVELMDKVHSGFSLHEFAVFYDINASYEENTNVDRATQPVMEALLTMKPGDIYVPVRDLFGWHIMYLVNHEPEKKQRPEDPEVRREIAEGIYAGVQERELMKFLGQQLGARKVLIKAGRIAALAQREKEKTGDEP